jgi:hypothetical protein
MGAAARRVICWQMCDLNSRSLSTLPAKTHRDGKYLPALCEEIYFRFAVTRDFFSSLFTKTNFSPRALYAL